ncbi:MAG: hypothetical protein KC800_10815 [Candidatus Eremiobacteraeota bacterium]|nr:hypothetical protein [Candidatus Eremiobacteraeota bacterium]
MRRKHLGVSLASILLCLAVLVAAIFLTVSASLSHLSLVGSLAQRQHAQNLAEAALSQAMSQAIQSDFVFGSRPTDRVQVTFPGLNDAEGIVTFSRSELPDGFSSYNLNSDASILGAGGTNLPPESIHMVARGRVGSTERWMECVFHRPPYPDGLVASGSVEAEGLQLSGVKQTDDYTGGDPKDVNPEDLIMANLFANGRGGGDPAVYLKADCDIRGSVGSPGKIQIDPGNTVRGEVLPLSEPRPIPSLDIRSRMSTLQINSVPVRLPTLDENWFSHSPGPLTVNGDLDLNGSALTVAGDLTVTGSIKGVGIILVDGSVDIQDGGSSVTSTDQVAVAATGDITLSASDMESNYFQGLLYSEGDVKASDITVVGTVVSNGKNGRDGNVELENVRFVRTPSSVELNLTAMHGFGYGDRSTAISITLTRAPDGETYIADARVAFTIDGDADNSQARLDDPYSWQDLGDTPHYETFTVNVGKPGQPNFGDELGRQIAEWIDPLDDRNSARDWIERYDVILNQELNGMFDQTPERYEIFLSLNNLLAEQFGEARVLIWRPFSRS